MWTAIAVIISLACSPIVKFVVMFVLSFILVALKRYDSHPLYWVWGLISQMSQAFAAVWVSHLVFAWVGIKFGAWVVVAISVWPAINHTARLLHFRRQKNFFLEISFAVGSALGYVLAAMYFAFQVDVRVVAGIAAVPVALLLYMVRTASLPSFAFWNLASEIPDEAYEWFLSGAAPLLPLSCDE